MGREKGGAAKVVKTSGDSTLDASFYKTLFENASDPMFIADNARRLIVEANDAFHSFTGYSPEDIRRSEDKPINLIAEESVPYIEEKRRMIEKDGVAQYEVKVIKKSGEKTQVEMSVRHIKLNDRDYVIGSFRDITQRKISQQESWERIRQLGIANTRIMTITEKIASIPEFAQKILGATSEAETLEKAAVILCDRLGMGYQSVTFYILKGEDLWLTYSTDAQKKTNQKLPKDHKFVKILIGKLQPIIEDKGGVVPIKDKEVGIGILEVYFNATTIEVFQGYRQAMKGYQDLIFAIAEIIGLRIGNLRLYDEVQKQSITDALTGLYNRRYFDERLKIEIERAKRSTTMLLSLMIVDVDNFKDVNDTYGHNQGDLVLTEIAKVLKSNTRVVDAACRYGGDEFVIIMPETPLVGARDKAEQLCGMLKDKRFPCIHSSEKFVAATVSIGVAAFEQNMEAQAFIKAADGAMYMAKAGGKNQIKTAQQTLRLG